jgi:hypothetical protein
MYLGHLLISSGASQTTKQLASECQTRQLGTAKYATDDVISKELFPQLPFWEGPGKQQRWAKTNHIEGKVIADQMVVALSSTGNGNSMCRGGKLFQNTINADLQT